MPCLAPHDVQPGGAPSLRVCHGLEDLMPYPRNHRHETKAKIVLSARRLFNRFGFDGVSIQRIMAEAGLTHGGFYKHFASKSDLYAEVLECFFTDPEWNSNWEGIHVDRKAADVGAQIVRAYLSRQHLEEIDNSCPMVALPSDVARSDKKAKQAFQTVFEAMVDMLQRSSVEKDYSSRTSALAIAALCVGGMVVARASEGHALANELRRSAMEVALKLGGWDDDTNSKKSSHPPK
jgi:TetR/AcrR family transcriptional regulator, transcriptional repressor for nem operon